MAYSKNDNHIIVNYHYVENPSPEFSGIYPCSVKDFEKQVKFLSENYKIVSVPSVIEAARDEKKDKFCAITFDDGLRDQYINACPILKKYNAIATFFPITSVFEGHLPTAHKVHILLSRLSLEKIIDTFHDFMQNFYPDLKRQYIIPKDRRLTERRLHESIPIANFKETMIMLPEDIKGQFLRYGFKIFGLNEKEISQKLFMSKQEVRSLHQYGMTIGSHSHNHSAFDIGNKDIMQKDIRLSKEILFDLLGNRQDIFSYPHGRNGPAALEVLAAEGFKYALTIDRRGISSSDNGLLLPRYDTADIVF